MVVTIAPDYAPRRRSYELLAGGVRGGRRLTQAASGIPPKVG